MNFRFWLSLFLSVFFPLLICFFAGLYFMQSHEADIQITSKKQQLKRENTEYLKELNRKSDFLIEEARKIQENRQILTDSPFFAWVLLDGENIETIYLANNDLFPKSFKQKKKLKHLSKKQSSQLVLQTEKKNKKLLYQFSKKILETSIEKDFHFKSLNDFDKNYPVVSFINSVDKNKKWIGFLKNNENFFQFLSRDDMPKTNKNKEVFIINSHGRLFFHNKRSNTFKLLSKKSPVWQSIKLISKKLEQTKKLTDSPKSRMGRYLKANKHSGVANIYYIQFWKKGNLFLITRTDFSFEVSYWGEFALKWFFICLVVACLVFILFYLRLSYLISAYNFLKFSVLSFDKIGIFPPYHGTKNFLLYFYNNRFLFLNKRYQKEENEKEQNLSLNFTDILRQELEIQKSKFPNFIVREDFEFDVKVFGFEKFLRTIIHEVILNALESMGGLKEQCLDISTREKDKNLVLSIRDYGKGIENKNFEKVFQLYYSKKSQLGVGLNVVKLLVESNSGKIELLTPKDGGVEVCIQLPLKCFLNHLNN